jgi:hypothetical protein
VSALLLFGPAVLGVLGMVLFLQVFGTRSRTHRYIRRAVSDFPNWQDVDDLSMDLMVRGVVHERVLATAGEMVERGELLCVTGDDGRPKYRSR